MARPTIMFRLQHSLVLMRTTTFLLAPMHNLVMRLISSNIYLTLTCGLLTLEQVITSATTQTSSLTMLLNPCPSTLEMDLSFPLGKDRSTSLSSDLVATINHCISSVNVQYTPSSFVNTISEDILEQHGVNWRSELQRFIHLPTGTEFATVTKQNGLKVLHVHTAPIATHHAISVPALPLDINLLHRQLAHLHVDGIRELMKQTGLSLLDSTPLSPCDACQLAKSRRIICRISHTRATRPFQIIHTDTCGKVSTPGIGNKHYFVLFTDDFSRFRRVVCLATKGQVFSSICHFFSSVTTQYKASIAELHLDNGTEFGGTQLTDFLTSHGCKPVFLASYHHEQNGIAEQSNGVDHHSESTCNAH